MRLNQVVGNNVYLRCPYCGDSPTNSHKAHLGVNILSGIYHCFRCGVSGKMDSGDHLELMNNPKLSDILSYSMKEKEEGYLIEPWPELLEGASNPRRSRLERFHVVHEKKYWDAFESRDLDGHYHGFVIRRPGQSKTYGDAMFGFFGEEFPTSSPENPIYLVEGPYDVIEDSDVCVYGIIRKKHLQYLAGHYVVLVPDGDVFQKPHLIRHIMQLLSPFVQNSIPSRVTESKYQKSRTSVKKSVLRANLVGLDFITNGKDPDDVPKGHPSRVELRSKKELRNLISYLSNSGD